MDWLLRVELGGKRVVRAQRRGARQPETTDHDDNRQLPRHGSASWASSSA
jgi:hypothetical protein